MQHQETTTASQAQAAEEVAWDRAETGYCERGTQGCSIHHTRDSDCETW